MYKDKKILAFIPARAGSTRIKSKNLRKINGLPLFVHSILVAKKSKYIDNIIVSSDSQKILNIAHQYGTIKNKTRPIEISNDKSRIIEAILYELRVCKQNFDTLILLQPTFPFRTPELIDDAIQQFFVHKEKSLVSVVKAKENPIFIRSIHHGQLKKIINKSSDIRSQDLDTYYKIIGNIYINSIKSLTPETIFNENIIPFEIDEKFCLDIDYLSDLKVARRRRV